MSIIEYLETIIPQLEEVLGMGSIIDIGTLSSDVTSVSIRPMPSSPTFYYTGDRGRRVTFQVLSKASGQKSALRTLETICDALVQQDAIIYSDPSFLQMDERSYIYTAAFAADLN